MTSYSSHEQEDWLREHFPEADGYAIDVGANDGCFYSNTLALEERGWTVLCVEANSDYEERLKGRRALVELCACGSVDADAVPFWVFNATPESASSLVLHGSEDGFSRHIVEVRTLDQLLEKHRFPRLDLLTVDVEGTEMDVLKGLDIQKWLPRVMIVESWDEEYQKRTFAHLAPFGYRTVRSAGVDWIYTRDPS